MFRNILVATGPSPWSSHAVDIAIRLAAHLRGELVIVHILEDDPQFQMQGSVTSDSQLRAEVEATGQHVVTQAAERAAQAQISHRIVTRWGGIPEQIVALAATNHCDLIVMGARHLTGDKRLMTGRICNAVLATASCPVLVVPFVQ